MHIYGSFCHSRGCGNPEYIKMIWIPDRVGDDEKTYYSANSADGAGAGGRRVV